jgi:glycine cleavage system H protein
MEEIRFTKEHYYIIIENDSATIGLTDYVLEKITDDINLIELPEMSSLYNKSEHVGSIFFRNNEIELYSPLTGEIIEINENLITEPDTIKNSTYEENWLFKIYLNEVNELTETLSEEEYNDYLENYDG